MLVEFIGLPGSGKSYISHHLYIAMAKENNIERVKEPTYHISRTNIVFRFFYKTFNSLYFAILSPRKTLRVARLLLKTKQKKAVVFFKVTFNTLYILGLNRRHNYQKYLIIDQGIIQNFFAINLNARYSINIREYLKTMEYMPDVLVFVNVSYKTAQERLNYRMNNQARSFQYIGQECFEHVLRHVQKMNDDVFSLQIDNDFNENIDSKIAVIIRAIDSM